MTSDVETRTVEHYLGLNYAISLRKDEEGDWVANVEELPGCTAHGESPAEAVTKIEEIKRAWVEDALEAGDPIPEPQQDRDLPSGKWLQRVPRSLHKKVADLAEQEGVSLNLWVTAVLSEAVGRKTEAAVESPDWIPVNIATGGWTSGIPVHRNWSETRDMWKGKWAVQEEELPNACFFDALSSSIVRIPNELNEQDFRMSERATKKERAKA